MSAIAKPFLRSTTCTTPHQLVPVEKIISMDVVTTTDTNSHITYHVLFTLDQTFSGPKEIKLTYASAVLRDASFTAMETVISASAV